MSLRRASALRLSLLRSLLEPTGARVPGCALPAASMACTQQPLLSLRDFGAPAPFSTSAPLTRAAEVAADPPSPPEPAFPPVYARLPDPVAARYTVDPVPVFAVVEVGGTQYKVTPDDVIIVEKLGGVDVNDRVALGRVLLVGTREETVIGRPYVPGARVVAAVEEQFLDGKVLIFHKRRRKNSRRLKGHRQPLTTLRVLAVEEGEAEGAEPEAAAA